MAVGSQIFHTDSLYIDSFSILTVKYMLLERSSKLRIAKSTDKREIQDVNERVVV